ncbi:MAG: nicotinate-nucleotide adenylyltransferase [Myxococcaceae bacterium]|nr:nicotinate-nucleotide adenylyltransferase [Myxococcaceae bacterium]
MAREPLILLGGTFDPPHIGHLVLAEFAWQELGGRVVFVPAGDPWRKAETPVTHAEHRVAMTELATDRNPRFAVDVREVQRPGPTYTVDTLEALHGEGHDQIVLLLGADALRDLANWKDPDRIRKLATLAVASRAGREVPAESGIVALGMPTLEVSSTAIRERVAAGKTIRYLVPDAVRDYILHHRLYSSEHEGERTGPA